MHARIPEPERGEGLQRQCLSSATNYEATRYRFYPAVRYTVPHHSNRHDTNLKGLKEAVEVMEEPQVTLYFVVPDEDFDKFRVNGIEDLREEIKRKQLPDLSLCVMELTYDFLRKTY
jgi:hypothetical protein